MVVNYCGAIFLTMWVEVRTQRSYNKDLKIELKNIYYI